jgi:hypothetical protein
MTTKSNKKPKAAPKKKVEDVSGAKKKTEKLTVEDISDLKAGRYDVEAAGNDCSYYNGKLSAG